MCPVVSTPTPRYLAALPKQKEAKNIPSDADSAAMFEFRTAALLLWHDGDRPDGQACRADEFERRADEQEAILSGGGQLREPQVLDDVDTMAGQQKQVARQRAAKLRVARADHVPGHIVGPDRQH